MGGLQKNLIQRSKNVFGYGEIDLWSRPGLAEVGIIIEKLEKLGLRAYPEYELELLVKNGSQMHACIVHGLESEFYAPEFISIREGRVISSMGADLVYRIHATKNGVVELISPAHTHNFLEEIPRSVQVAVEEQVQTQVPEVDLLHFWTRASVVNNLTRSKTFNKIRILTEFNKTSVYSVLMDVLGDNFRILKWEEKNQALVWALGLETLVMTFLFIIMSLLVSISITTGLMIFSDKIKIDLASFWILGCRPEILKTNALIFLLSIGPVTTLMGIILAFFFLFVLKHFPPDIMPHVFVERSIPVEMSLRGLLISFFTPVGISTFFSLASFKNFTHKTGAYLKLLRSVGT